MPAANIKLSDYSYVLAGRSSTLAVVSGTTPILVYNSEITDVLGEYNPATGVFTALYAGNYHVSATYRYQEANTSTVNLIQINKNGSVFRNKNTSSTVSAYTNLGIDASVPLAAGDTLNIVLNHNAGANRTLDSDATSVFLTIARES